MNKLILIGDGLLDSSLPMGAEVLGYKVLGNDTLIRDLSD